MKTKSLLTFNIILKRLLWPYREKNTVLGHIWAFFGPIFGPFCGRRRHSVTQGYNLKTQNPQLASFDESREAAGQLNTN